jgi:tRNA-modifying protein YgfZ
MHPDTAVLGDVAGRAIVLRYGEVAAEYGALRTGAMLVDHSHRHRSRITGARAAETLAGLVTNDVKSLVIGQGQYAAALTPKGKIVADLRILARPGNVFLLDTGRRAAEGWMSVLRKYVNPRSAPYADVSEEFAVIGLYGPHARRLIAQHFAVTPESLAALAAYSQIGAER